MFSIIGLVGVLVIIFGIFLVEGGSMEVLAEAAPMEFAMIFGSALAAQLVANDLSGLMKMGGGLAQVMAGPKWKKQDYQDLLALLFQLTKLMKTKGVVALEAHIEKPDESAIFQKYPKILKDHHVTHFICDTLRMMTMNLDDPHQVEDAMEKQLEKHHHEAMHPAHALQSMADGLPALGIVAAVLGIVKTMGAISEPPEVLGLMIDKALVGTFLGVFLAYGIVGPMAQRLNAAVRHLRGGTLTDRTHDAGLAAWATLEETLESGRFDPPGLAWTFQQLSEARAAATAWLGSVRGHFGPAAAASLERAERAWGRASEALADAAARLPFPPALSSAGLTTTVVTRLLERVREAALAEFDGLRAVEAALAAAREDDLALRVRDLALADAGALFACVRDLPLGDLGPATEQARKRAIPDGMRAKVLESAGSVVGHVYSSLLGSARAPLLGPEGVAAERVLVLHCPWVDRRLRGRGLGRRLIEAVIADARAQRLLGIAMIATAEEQFLGDTAMKHLGWVEVDRREDDDARLLWLALTAPGGTQPAPLPRFAAPQTLVTTASPASLPVVTVRHAYHCPLLLASRQHTARAARSAEVSLDEADAPAAGGAAGARATVRGHDLPWGWLPATASAQIIEEARRG